MERWLSINSLWCEQRLTVVEKSLVTIGLVAPAVIILLNVLHRLTCN